MAVLMEGRGIRFIVGTFRKYGEFFVEPARALEQEPRLHVHPVGETAIEPHPHSLPPAGRLPTWPGSNPSAKRFPHRPKRKHCGTS